MRRFCGILAGVLAVALLAGPALCQEEAPLPNEKWSFSGLFGSFDLAAAQRGFWVYKNVCANCHSMTQLHYATLPGSASPRRRSGRSRHRYRCRRA